MFNNLFTEFQNRFPKNLSAPFITTRNGNIVHYSNVEEMSSRFACLINDLGIKPGDRVVVYTEKSPAALLLYLGCLRAGAVYVPLNTAYTGDELGYFLADSTPKLVVCDPSTRNNFRVRVEAQGISHLLTLDSAGQGSLQDQAKTFAGENYEAHSCGYDGLAAILYSSGTTGQPKGTMISHGALAENANDLHKVWKLGIDDVLLHALPIFHTHGLFVATNTILMNGTRMILHDRFDADAIIEDLSKVTLFMGVPTYYQRLLSNQAFSEDVCRTIRLFISGSAPLLAETFAAFTKRSGHTIVERYGMTEAGIITSAGIDKPRCNGTVGLPLDGVTLRIANDMDIPRAIGETGEIQIKGKSLFSGYWNQPEKTAREHTHDGFFRTGDVGFIEPNGELTIVGRSKDMFISGGFNVFPKEIEQIINTIDGVDEATVIGLPHPDFGEAGLAIIVSNGEAIDEDAIHASLKKSLANYKLPKMIVQIDALPRNAMGKVQKNVLRKSYRSMWDSFLENQ